MTARTANRRLYVTAVSLLTSLLALVGMMVRLVASCVTWLVRRVERSTARHAGTPSAASLECPRLALVRPTSPKALGDAGQRERLTTALVGLGFAAPAVRRYVEGLHERATHEPIEALIKEGLRALAA